MRLLVSAVQHLAPRPSSKCVPVRLKDLLQVASAAPLLPCVLHHHLINLHQTNLAELLHCAAQALPQETHHLNELTKVDKMDEELVKGT